MKAAALIAAAVLTLAHAQSPPVETVFFPAKLAEMDAAISLAISEGRCPGGVLWVERGGAAYRKAYGQRAVEPVSEAMTEDTIFDAASLTKVIATTSAVMKLFEREQIDLSALASRYLPEFRGAGKEAITVRQLLTHTSGLRAGLPLSSTWSGAEAAFSLACAEPLPDRPGSTFRYSDVNFILLGELVHRVSGRTLDEFASTEIFAPLGMKDTGYRPPEAWKERVAPTERTKDGILRGVVHDPTARRMGGVAGHAGLFTSARDVARFARMILQRGELDGVRIFDAKTVETMTTVQGPPGLPMRGLGWDIDSAYAGPRGAWLPVGSFGHTGWTGGSLWVDPFSQTFVIFLSNRNHPTEAGNVIALRRTLGTLVAEAVRGFNFLQVPGALAPGRGVAVGARPPKTFATHGRVLTGIDVLERDGFKQLRGLRVGLITNQTGIDRARRSTIDVLREASPVKIVALFSPEHGIRGVLDAKVGDSRDEKTGLPIYSLYGESRAPSPAQLADCDALVFDIQDIGCRFYTYISTLGECLTAASKAGKKFVVLDRPNPVGGGRVEGPMLGGPRSFTGWHELPVRHGMTAGELAQMFNVERSLGVDLVVVKCEGWERGQWFDETGLPWINPSPNMRSLHAAALYPGVGLLEFCQLSVGRGTDRPFEKVGAPYIDDQLLARELNTAALAGVRFVPIRFTPTASVFAGKECRGVEILVLDRDALDAVDLGLTLARTLQRLHPTELKIEKMEKLLVHPPTLAALRENQPLTSIRAGWVKEREEFRARREKFLLYR